MYVHVQICVTWWQSYDFIGDKELEMKQRVTVGSEVKHIEGITICNLNKMLVIANQL